MSTVPSNTVINAVELAHTEVEGPHSQSKHQTPPTPLQSSRHGIPSGISGGELENVPLEALEASEVMKDHPVERIILTARGAMQRRRRNSRVGTILDHELINVSSSTFPPVD